MDSKVFKRLKEVGGVQVLLHVDLTQLKALCFPDRPEKSSDTLELPAHGGLYFSWSNHTEPRCPLAPSPISVQGSGMVLMKTVMVLLLQAVSADQTLSLDVQEGEGSSLHAAMLLLAWLLMSA